jgi:hypothetical protein
MAVLYLFGAMYLNRSASAVGRADAPDSGSGRGAGGAAGVLEVLRGMIIVIVGYLVVIAVAIGMNLR